MACLDTTILIDATNRRTKSNRNAIRKIQELLVKGEVFVTTRFNVAELYVGIARSDHPEREEAKVQNLLNYISVLEFDDRSAWVIGQITAYLQKRGTPVGDMDVLIAATAIASGHTLITRNPSHFENIPHLVVEDY